MKKHLTGLREGVPGCVPRRVGVYAANASFFIILSVFPALLLLLGILGCVPMTAAELGDFLDLWLPETIAPLVDSILAEMVQEGKPTALLSLSALTALWSAARGMLGILNGLNEVYGVEDSRGYLLRRAMSGAYTLLLTLAIVLTLGLHLLGDRLLAALKVRAADTAQAWAFFRGIRGLVVVPILTLTFAVLYRVLPDRENRFRSQLPGAFAAALAWEGFSRVFSLYLKSSTSLLELYGSLVTIAAAMLWLYFCMTILFYGGALNRCLEQRRCLRQG